MAKILLLDFEEKDGLSLLDKGFEVELKRTSWKTQKTESLAPAEDCQLVFYQIHGESTLSEAHLGDSGGFEKIVENGGAIVCFIGSGQEYQLTNIIGHLPNLEFHENSTPTMIIPTIQDNLVNPIFNNYKKFISQSFELFPVQHYLGKAIELREWDPSATGQLYVLAESSNRFPVSVLIRKGQGFYLLLPWFGEKNIEIAEFLLSETLPEVAPHLFSEEKTDWLDKPEFYFPDLIRILEQKEMETKKYQQTLQDLDEKIKKVKEKEQAPRNKLLIAQGKDLKQAVVHALQYLGWSKVVDVDDYWKHVIRNKEEDLWLFEDDEQRIEEKIKKDAVFLVNVRSSREGATDEDCAVLQKYKGRRMQEFSNTNMKALLIGNYFCKHEPSLREIPFLPAQIEEAVKDGNGLLTTHELFKALKAEKEGKIKKEDIRNQIKTKAGLIKFEY